MREVSLSRYRPGLLLVGYLSTAVAFLSMDAVWLASMGAALYQPALGHLMAASVDWVAAVAFYALYVAGLMVFAVLPARRARAALWRGACLGLLAYATYDLTNQATLKDWPWHITLIDLLWGSTVSGLASAAGAVVLRLTSRRGSRGSAR